QNIAFPLQREPQHPMRRDRVDCAMFAARRFEERPVLFEFLPCAVGEYELPRPADGSERSRVELVQELMVLRLVPPGVPINEEPRSKAVQPRIGKPLPNDFGVTGRGVEPEAVTQTNGR